MIRRFAPLALAAVLWLPAGLQAAEPWDYPGDALLDVCRTADNESRLVGQAAEVECEQYMTGFTDALIVTGALKGICLPEQNRPDEVRWAYMYWVNQHFSRRKEPAAALLLDTLKDRFKCK